MVIHYQIDNSIATTRKITCDKFECLRLHWIVFINTTYNKEDETSIVGTEDNTSIESIPFIRLVYSWYEGVGAVTNGESYVEPLAINSNIETYKAVHILSGFSHAIALSRFPSICSRHFIPNLSFFIILNT